MRRGSVHVGRVRRRGCGGGRRAGGALRRRHRGRRRQLRGGGRADHRGARAERGRQDLDDRGARGVPTSRRRSGVGPRPRSTRRPRGADPPDGGDAAGGRGRTRRARCWKRCGTPRRCTRSPSTRSICCGSVGLAGLERRTWRQISGGEQRRLALALALVGRPQVAFLDEPSSGVDPVGRQQLRAAIAELRGDGVTVLLTSHDLDEVERLADHVVILDRGRVLAAGTPAALTGGRSTRCASARLPGLDVGALAARLARARGRARRRGVPGAGGGHARASSRRSRHGWRSTTSRSPTCEPAGSGSRTSSSAWSPTRTPRREAARRPPAPRAGAPRPQRRVAAPDARHPRGAAGVLLQRRRAPHRWRADRLPRARGAVAGGAVHRVREPGDRRGVRAGVRRAQAVGRHARSDGPGCSAPRRWPSSRWRRCRSRCCGSSPSPSAGNRRRSRRSWWRWCSERWPSPGWASAWPARCGRSSRWRRPTASTSCSCCCPGW